MLLGFKDAYDVEKGCVPPQTWNDFLQACVDPCASNLWENGKCVIDTSTHISSVPWYSSPIVLGVGAIALALTGYKVIKK
jgi:hypothetical protein